MENRDKEKKADYLFPYKFFFTIFTALGLAAVLGAGVIYLYTEHT